MLTGPKYEKICVGNSINLICARYQKLALIKWYKGYYNRSEQITVEVINVSNKGTFSTAWLRSDLNEILD